jgi:hypothetical protein
MRSVLNAQHMWPQAPNTCILSACLPCRATAGGVARQIDSYLGVLYLVQDYKVYGYVTNTGVRFVLVVDDNDSKDDRWCCVGAVYACLLLLLLLHLSDDGYNLMHARTHAHTHARTRALEHTRSIIKALFRKLHTLFTEIVSNPFYQQGQPLTSKKLDADIGLFLMTLLFLICCRVFVRVFVC